MKRSCNIFLCIILLLLFATSCHRAIPDKETELIEQIRALLPLTANAPDSVLVLLDNIRSENQLSATEEATFYNVRGGAYRTLQQLDAAKEAHRTALHLLENMSDNDWVRVRKAMTTSNIATVYLAMGEPQTAIDFMQQTLTLWDRVDEPEPYLQIIASIYRSIALAFSATGNIESALYYIQLGRCIAEEIGDRRGEGANLAMIGALHFHLGNYEQAEENLRSAILILEEMDLRMQLWEAYMNLTAALVMQGRPEEALIYAKKTDEIATSIGFPAVAMHNHYAQWGQNYLDAGDYRRSLAMFYRALELRSVMGNLSLLGLSKYAIGKAYGRMGNFERALYYTDEARRIAHEQQLYTLQLSIYRSLLYIYAASGNMDNFVATLEAEQQARDAFFSEQNANALHEMQVRFDTERTQMELAYQIEENRRKHANNLLLVFTIIVFVIASALFSIYQRKRIQNIKRTVQQYEAILKLKKETQKKVDTSATSGERKKEIVSEMSEKLMPEIERLFNEEKIYKRQGLTMDNVAKMLNTNQRYLSIVINECYQTTFPEFVKTFRIDETIEMFKESHENGKYANYTLQAIAEEAGFIGKNTFYSAFKEVTGVTPTEYLKTLREKQPNNR